MFYPSAERIWLCIRLHNAGKYCFTFCDFGKKKIIFSDEAHFDLSGYVDKKNCRIWDTKTNTHTLKSGVTVWCWFWSRDIIGPFLFENEQGEAVTVNSYHYRVMLNKFLFMKIDEQDIGKIWFQQDGATCRTVEATLAFFALFLKITLSVAELMSFGHLGAGIWHRWTVKGKCYGDKPEPIDALKNNIREAICEIQLHTIDSVIKNWTDRELYCMASRGSHLNEIIFHFPY